MKIDYPDGCEQEWRLGLSSWQLNILRNLHRQGRGLPDRTNHGDDERWQQAGVRTRDSYGQWKRNGRGKYHHERVMIQRTDYGFIMSGLRRSSVVVIDPETGQVTEVGGWVFVWTWYVTRDGSANYPPKEDPS